MPRARAARVRRGAIGCEARTDWEGVQTWIWQRRAFDTCMFGPGIGLLGSERKRFALLCIRACFASVKRQRADTIFMHFRSLSVDLNAGVQRCRWRASYCTLTCDRGLAQMEYCGCHTELIRTALVGFGPWPGLRSLFAKLVCRVGSSVQLAELRAGAGTSCEAPLTVVAVVTGFGKH